MRWWKSKPNKWSAIHGGMELLFQGSRGNDAMMLLKSPCLISKRWLRLDFEFCCFFQKKKKKHVHFTWKTWFTLRKPHPHFTCTNTLSYSPCPIRGQYSTFPTLKNVRPFSFRYFSLLSPTLTVSLSTQWTWTVSLQLHHLHQHPLLLGQTLFLPTLGALQGAFRTNGKLEERSSGRRDTRYTGACAKEMRTNGWVKCASPVRSPGYG